MTCLVIITLHCIAGLATSWCEFLLKFFVSLFMALGHTDIAAQIPDRLPTAQSYAGIPTYKPLLLPVCRICGDVYPTQTNECPRCSVLFEEISQAERKPPIRLPFLSISAQLESILSSPGIEDAVDWWRGLPPLPPKEYRDISDGKMWNEIRDPEGQRFFRSIPGKNCAPDGELRIGVALAMDWWVHIPPSLECTDNIPGSMSPGVHYQVATALLHSVSAF